jgi:hypothetical protein
MFYRFFCRFPCFSFRRSLDRHVIGSAQKSIGHNYSSSSFRSTWLAFYFYSFPLSIFPPFLFFKAQLQDGVLHILPLLIFPDKSELAALPVEFVDKLLDLITLTHRRLVLSSISFLISISHVTTFQTPLFSTFDRHCNLFPSGYRISSCPLESVSDKI